MGGGGGAESPEVTLLLPMLGFQGKPTPPSCATHLVQASARTEAKKVQKVIG